MLSKLYNLLSPGHAKRRAAPVDDEEHQDPVAATSSPAGAEVMVEEAPAEAEPLGHQQSSDEDDEDNKEAHERDLTKLSYDEWTIMELRELLKTRNLNRRGKKEELVDRIRESNRRLAGTGREEFNASQAAVLRSDMERSESNGKRSRDDAYSDELENPPPTRQRVEGTASGEQQRDRALIRPIFSRPGAVEGRSNHKEADFSDESRSSSQPTVVDTVRILSNKTKKNLWNAPESGATVPLPDSAFGAYSSRGVNPALLEAHDTVSASRPLSPNDMAAQPPRQRDRTNAGNGVPSRVRPREGQDREQQPQRRVKRRDLGALSHARWSDMVYQRLMDNMKQQQQAPQLPQPPAAEQRQQLSLPRTHSRLRSGAAYAPTPASSRALPFTDESDQPPTKSQRLDVQDVAGRGLTATGGRSRRMGVQQNHEPSFRMTRSRAPLEAQPVFFDDEETKTPVQDVEEEDQDLVFRDPCPVDMGDDDVGGSREEEEGPAKAEEFIFSPPIKQRLRSKAQTKAAAVDVRRDLAEADTAKGQAAARMAMPPPQPKPQVTAKQQSGNTGNSGSTANGWGDLMHVLQRAGWKCDTCLSTGIPESKTKCPSCETPRASIGGESQAAGEGSAKGASSASSAPSQRSSSIFQPSLPSVSSESVKIGASGFSFGGVGTAPSSSSSSGFSFGGSSQAKASPAMPASSSTPVSSESFTISFRSKVADTSKSDAREPAAPQQSDPSPDDKAATGQPAPFTFGGASLKPPAPAPAPALPSNMFVFGANQSTAAAASGEAGQKTTFGFKSSSSLSGSGTANITPSFGFSAAPAASPSPSFSVTTAPGLFDPPKGHSSAPSASASAPAATALLSSTPAAIQDKPGTTGSQALASSSTSTSTTTTATPATSITYGTALLAKTAEAASGPKVATAEGPAAQTAPAAPTGFGAGASDSTKAAGSGGATSNLFPSTLGGTMPSAAAAAATLPTSSSFNFKTPAISASSQVAAPGGNAGSSTSAAPPLFGGASLSGTFTFGAASMPASGSTASTAVSSSDGSMDMSGGGAAAAQGSASSTAATNNTASAPAPASGFSSGFGGANPGFTFGGSTGPAAPFGAPPPPSSGASGGAAGFLGSGPTPTFGSPPPVVANPFGAKSAPVVSGLGGGALGGFGSSAAGTSAFGTPNPFGAPSTFGAPGGMSGFTTGSASSSFGQAAPVAGGSGPMFGASNTMGAPGGFGGMVPTTGGMNAGSGPGAADGGAFSIGSGAPRRMLKPRKPMRGKP